MTLSELNHHFELKMQLNKAQEALDGLRAAAEPGAQVITGMPHATGVKDLIGELAVEIVIMEDRVKQLQAEVEKDKANVESYINHIDDDRLRLIFRLRFIMALTWKDVATVVGGRNTEDGVKSACYRYIGAK